MTRVPPPFTWNSEEKSLFMIDKFKFFNINLEFDPFIEICVFMKNKLIPNNSEFEEIVTDFVSSTTVNLMERFLLEDAFKSSILK